MANNPQPPLLFLSDKELQASFQSPESLPLQDALILAIEPPKPGKRLFGLSASFAHTPIEPQMILWVDTTKRPEIRDLPRVHATDGPGTFTCTWSFINEGRLDCYFVVHIAMTSPVRVSFRVPIFIREWYTIIDTVSQTGSISLLAGPPVKWRELPKSLKPVELEEMIHIQSGGGITLTFDDETRHELRQHFEDHLVAITRLLGRG